MKKSSLYSQSLLIFIHNTPVVENGPTTREIRDLLRPRLTPLGKTFYFKMIISLIYLQEYTEEASNTASGEDIMENNYYMFVMIGNLSVMSHVPVT